MLNYAASFPKCKIRCVQLWDKEPWSLNGDASWSIPASKSVCDSVVKNCHKELHTSLKTNGWRAPKWWALEKVDSGFKYGHFWYQFVRFLGCSPRNKKTIHLSMPTYSSSQSMPDFGTLDLLGGSSQASLVVRITSIYKPFKPFGRRTTLLRGLTITMVTNHLQVLGWSSKYTFQANHSKPEKHQGAPPIAPPSPQRCTPQLRKGEKHKKTSPAMPGPQMAWRVVQDQLDVHDYWAPQRGEVEAWGSV